MRWWWGLLCTKPTLSLIFIALAHWNNSLRIDMLPHSDKLSWLWTNQSLLFLLNAATNTNFKSFVWPDQSSNPRSTPLEASMLTITSLMWFIQWRICSQHENGSDKIPMKWQLPNQIKSDSLMNMMIKSFTYKEANEVDRRLSFSSIIFPNILRFLWDISHSSR